MKNTKIVKYVLTVAAILYILGIYFVPFMKPCMGSWVAWLIFGIYCLNLVFFWAISGKKSMTVDDKEEAKISQELLKDRNKWVV